MNKKEWLASGGSVIGIILALIALKPEDWINNIASWKTLFLLLAIICFTAFLSFLASKKIFNDGYIMAFKSRTNIRLKNLLAKEFDTTKNITTLGIACDEISKQSDDFWKSFLTERDGRLRMIFADPNGIQIGLREQMVCGYSKGEFADSVKYNLRILVGKIEKIKAKENTDDIRAEIRINDFAPVINCIITDNCVFLHHYGSSTRGIDMPTYVIRKGRNKINNQIYSFYNAMFNELWKKSSICEEEDYHVLQTASR